MHAPTSPHDRVGTHDPSLLSEATRIARVHRALATFMPPIPKLALIGICSGKPAGELAVFCGCDGPAANAAIDYLLDGGYLLRFQDGMLGIDASWAGEA